MPDFSFTKTEFAWGHDNYGWIAQEDGTGLGVYDVDTYQEAKRFPQSYEAENFRKNYPEAIDREWQLYKITTTIEPASLEAIARLCIEVTQGTPNHKIAAIKEYRTRTRATLKQALDMINREWPIREQFNA